MLIVSTAAPRGEPVLRGSRQHLSLPLEIRSEGALRGEVLGVRPSGPRGPLTLTLAASNVNDNPSFGWIQVQSEELAGIQA
jgi:hypothetical protein